MPAATLATEAAESISTSGGRPATLTWVPGVSAMSLKEWPVPRARMRSVLATRACSWPTVAGRLRCAARNATLPAQFLRDPASMFVLPAVSVVLPCFPRSFSTSPWPRQIPSADGNPTCHLLRHFSDVSFRKDRPATDTSTCARDSGQRGPDRELQAATLFWYLILIFGGRSLAAPDRQPLGP